MYQCDSKKLLTYLKNRKKQNNIFVIPFHLKETGEAVHTWDQVQKRTQIIIDQRSEVDKANVRLNRYCNTFKNQNCNVFQDRPKLISFEPAFPSDWRPSVHNLKEFGQIVQITADEGSYEETKLEQGEKKPKERNVKFLFWDNQTFYET